jgi:hypothetical protein
MEVFMTSQFGIHREIVSKLTENAKFPANSIKRYALTVEVFHECNKFFLKL